MFLPHNLEPRWWDWSRWEKELDWAALWGVNLVLAYTGQEQIFKQVYNSIGVALGGTLRV